MLLDTEVGLGPGDIVLDGDPTPPPIERGTAAPTFRPISIVVKRSPISATTELLLRPQIFEGLRTGTGATPHSDEIMQPGPTLFGPNDVG